MRTKIPKTFLALFASNPFDNTLVPSFSFGKREDPGDECCWNPIWRPVFALEVAYASEFVCLRTTTQDIEL